ncbi:MAG: T9SS type A sorting domain-containing protein [Bacteroidales bacterium]|nr:T9SS type A sorting domain-containing protein [Bacteroidales bacterium]
MKRSLPFPRLSVSLFLMGLTTIINGQTIVFSEDFSGFTTGSHTLPSTSDVSATLDSRTQTPGWTGFKVYSAGGEIKIGTSTVTGWIETPSIDFTGYDAGLVLKFNISRWPGDATTVKILLNEDQLGDLLEPEDEYSTVSIPITAGITSGKIRFEAQSKRFFLDNVIIYTDEVTSVHGVQDTRHSVTIYPNPARDFITLGNIRGCDRIEILDTSGRIQRSIDPAGSDKMEVSLAGLPGSVYLVKFHFPGSYVSRTVIRY